MAIIELGRGLKANSMLLRCSTSKMNFAELILILNLASGLITIPGHAASAL